MATNNAGNVQARESRPETKSFSGERREGKPRNAFQKNENRGKYTGEKRTGFKQGKAPMKGNRNGFDKGFDKDKDEEEKVIRRKPVQKDKPKEQQSDKMEIMQRLEREKKAVKKKQNASQRDGKSMKHQMKPKRSRNIDWTREYENDSYDDDDLDMYY